MVQFGEHARKRDTGSNPDCNLLFFIFLFSSIEQEVYMKTGNIGTSKIWYHFTDEFVQFLEELVEDTFGTKTALAECMKICLDVAGIKCSIACCMYDISYMGCPGDRLGVYKIAFKSMGFEGELV